MHLLSLNSYHYRRGGSDVVYFDHEALFASLGWKTAHMAMRHPKNLPSPWSEYFVDEIEFGHDYGALQKLAMAGKVIYSFEARRRLAALLDHFPADVAHVHCIYHHLSPSVLSLLNERGIPVVLTAHDLKIACPAYKMLNRTGVCERCKGGNLLQVVAHRCVRDSLPVSAVVAVESLVSRALGLYRKNVSRVVTPSHFYARKLQEWGWPAAQLETIPNYVQAEDFVAAPQPGDYLLYFGRLAPEKGVDTLIHAARATGMPLRIAGTGPVEAELRRLADGCSNISFLGFVAGEPLRVLIRSALAVVLPSKWYENCPMSILEAFASGKPVLAADIGGIPEMVVDGETGFLFRSGDPQSLLAAVDHLAGMPPSKIAEMGSAARDHVVRNYSPARYLMQMRQLYARLGVAG